MKQIKEWLSEFFCKLPIYNCKSISYTYVEPTIFTEYVLDVMKLAQAADKKPILINDIDTGL